MESPVDQTGFRHRLEWAYRTLAEVFAIDDEDRAADKLSDAICLLIEIDEDFFPLEEEGHTCGLNICPNCDLPYNDICHVDPAVAGQYNFGYSPADDDLSHVHSVAGSATHVLHDIPHNPDDCPGCQ